MTSTLFVSSSCQLRRVSSIESLRPSPGDTMIRSRFSFAAALAAATFAGAAASAQSPHYHVVKTLDLGPVRADYIIIDPVGRRLYGLGDKVIDVDKDAVIGTIPDGGGGYAIDHEDNRGLVR